MILNAKGELGRHRRDAAGDHTRHGGTGEVGVREVSAGEGVVGQVCTGQIDAFQVDAGQIDAGQIDPRPRQVPVDHAEPGGEPAGNVAMPLEVTPVMVAPVRSAFPRSVSLRFAS